ncbi:MAG: DUF1778 domain-containing protein [Gammaproteobacteria bacterium]|nr:DUF1778 domain-containing protein [Gammaproteobacteria bacterium]
MIRQYIGSLLTVGSANHLNENPFAPEYIDTVKYRTFRSLVMTTSPARFDLKLDSDEKKIVARAAALMGTTMAGFVRAAAKEKAQALLERETRVVLSERDFARFAAAVSGPFEPNPALSQALKEARRKVRRA